MKNMPCLAVSCPAALVVILAARTASATLYTASSPEEAMVFSGAPTTVWDPKGGTEISSNGLNKGYGGGNPTTGVGSTNVEYSLMDFNTAPIVTAANAAYGVGGWTITGVGLTLASNFGTAGVFPNTSVFNEIEPGYFNMNWISNNGWTGDQVTWNNLSNYLPGVGNNLEEGEGTLQFLANGTTPNTWSLTPTADLLSDIDSGGTVSFLGTPADNNVGFLFNTPTQSNPAILNVTISVPEPGSCGIVAASLGIGALVRHRRGGL